MARGDEVDDRNRAAMQALEASADALARPAWTWELEDGDGSVSGSKIGGVPYVSDVAPWPRCGVCTRPMGFVLQIDLAELEGREGLLQLFSCEAKPSIERLEEMGGGGVTDVPGVYVDDLARMFARVPLTEIQRIATAWRDGWPVPAGDRAMFESVGLNASSATFLLDAGCHCFAPMSGGASQLARIVDPVALASPPPPPDDAPEPLESRRIERFERHRERPAFDDLPDSLALFDQLTRAQKVLVRRFTRRGDKLFGWPYWLQGEGWVNCPTCGQPTNELVLVLESGDDCALQDLENCSLYVVRCARHPRSLVWVTQDG